MESRMLTYKLLGNSCHLHRVCQGWCLRNILWRSTKSRGTKHQYVLKLIFLQMNIFPSIVSCKSNFFPFRRLCEIRSLWIYVEKFLKILLLTIALLYSAWKAFDAILVSWHFFSSTLARLLQVVGFGEADILWARIKFYTKSQIPFIMVFYWPKRYRRLQCIRGSYNAIWERLGESDQ